MKNIPYVLIALVVVVTACNKDQKLNNKLDGSWRVTTYNDSEEGFGFFNDDSLVTLNEVQSMEFLACDQKDAFCTGDVTGSTTDTIVNQVIGLSFGFTYKVDGEKLNMDIQTSKTSTQTVSWDIKELKGGSLTLESEGNSLKLEQVFDR